VSISDFEQARATSFDHSDWTEITLNSYQSRWRSEPRDSRYDDVHDAIAATASSLTRWRRGTHQAKTCRPRSETNKLLDEQGRSRKTPTTGSRVLHQQ
jgi:hypothetical protein